MNRRSFLRNAAGAASLIAASPLWLQRLVHGAAAQSGAARRVVALMLDGGNDWLNTIVPHADDLYHRARPDLALSPRSLLRLDDENGWHPTLVQTRARFEAGGMAILRGVGCPQPNLSHFRAKDILDSADPSAVGVSTGWLGRLVDAKRPEGTEPTALVSVGSVATPLVLRAKRHEACALPGREGFRVRVAPADASDSNAAARRRALERVNRLGGDSRTADVAGSVGSAKASIEALDRALARSPRSPYPDSRLASHLEIVARVIEADLPTVAFHVADRGYDTHASQAPTHAGLLSVLDGALHAFLSDLAQIERLEQTLVVVVSEFGRRVAQNGIGATAGTDHGTAGQVWFFGGSTRAGLHGVAPQLDRLDANGNLLHDVDFRSVYADVVEGWFGAKQEPVLGARFDRAGVVAS